MTDRERDVFAPPKAALTDTRQRGNVYCVGKLVRMDRAGSLPDRCVVCNGDANGERVSHAAYWTPPTTRWVMIAIPFVVLGAGMVGGSVEGALLFWPVVLLMVIANALVREKVTLDIGECRRHARTRTISYASAMASVLATIALVIVSLLAREYNDRILSAMLAMIPLMAVFAGVQARIGTRKVAVARLDDTHLWIKGCGKPFREALPPMPVEP